MTTTLQRRRPTPGLARAAYTAATLTGTTLRRKCKGSCMWVQFTNPDGSVEVVCAVCGNK